MAYTKQVPLLQTRDLGNQHSHAYRPTENAAPRKKALKCSAVQVGAPLLCDHSLFQTTSVFASTISLSSNALKVPPQARHPTLEPQKE